MSSQPPRVQCQTRRKADPLREENGGLGMTETLVYALVRRDLNEAYIGQTQDLNGRLWRHERHALRKHLWEDREPDVWIMGRFSEAGVHVTEHESEAMDVMAARGFDVISKKGGGVHIALRGARLGSAARDARRAADPALDDKFRADRSRSGKKGGATQRKRAAEDPDNIRKHEQRAAHEAERLTPEYHAKQLVIQRRTAAQARAARDSDPQLREKWLNAVTEAACVDYICDECDRVTTAMGMGWHHKKSGHSGKTKVITDDE